MVCIPVWQMEKLRLPEKERLAPGGRERKRWSHGKCGHSRLAARIIAQCGVRRYYLLSEALQQMGGLSQ